MPPALRLGDLHACPACTPAPHVGGPATGGAANVLIGGLPAARAGDRAACSGGTDVIVKGSPTVLIGGKPAARVGDQSSHGGVAAIGCPTVFIGDAGGPGPREGTAGASGAAGLGTAASLARPGSKDSNAPGQLVGQPGGKVDTLPLLLGAPASMELVGAFLSLASGFLADFAKLLSPGTCELLGAAIESARRTLAVKNMALLTEQLALVQGRLQTAAAEVPPEQLKEAAANANPAEQGPSPRTGTASPPPLARLNVREVEGERD